MAGGWRFDIGLDLFPMLAAVLAAVGCGVLGNFLVLRKLSLMGDAISHSVLPGLVIAFLIASTRSTLVMFLGAGLAGVGTVALVEAVKRIGRVEPGAAMGVVFCVLFALGVLLIEQAAVRHIDLDADCVLHGQLETLVWYGAPQTMADLLRWSTLEAVPRQVTTLAVMSALAFVFVGVFFKELRITAFDASMATSQGINASGMHYLLMIFVAAATVASFEAVGSILVIAMLICPAATARLLTDRLATQLLWSVVVALVSSVGGYIAATAVPAQWEKDAVNAAGMMTVAAGLCVTGALIGSPRHGTIARSVRRRKLARQVELDNLLALLYRAKEDSKKWGRIVEQSLSKRQSDSRVLRHAVRGGLVERDGRNVVLTPIGEQAARGIVRKHRLWEHFLVEEAGLSPDHVHDTAEQLEHISADPGTGPKTDPHGQIIPPA